MPRKISPKTDWEPIDLLRGGKPIYKTLPRQKISNCLATLLPKWDRLDQEAQSAARTVVFDAFINLIKARKDRETAPRLRTVKANLNLIDKAANKLIHALKAMDLRTATLLKKAAGSEFNALKPRNDSPLNESPMAGGIFERGHHRVRLLERAVQQATQWTARAKKELPKQDGRTSEEPGLEAFAERIGYLWENYAPGEKIGGSRNDGTWPHFIYEILTAGGIQRSRFTVEGVARNVAAAFDSKHPDRLIVPTERRHFSLAELARRKPRPKKGKRTPTG